jgi:hypothetical protein
VENITILEEKLTYLSVVPCVNEVALGKMKQEQAFALWLREACMYVKLSNVCM